MAEALDLAAALAADDSVFPGRWTRRCNEHPPTTRRVFSGPFTMPPEHVYGHGRQWHDAGRSIGLPAATHVEATLGLQGLMHAQVTGWVRPPEWRPLS